MLSAFFLSFGVTFVAELGDKSHWHGGRRCVGDLGWLPLGFTIARENNSLWCFGLVRGFRNFVDCARHLNAY